jgi:hypothetical protein
LIEKKGKVMEKKMLRIIGIVGLILVIISLMVIGCSREQAPPPAQTPPPAATVQTPVPTGTAPAGTAQTAPVATPAQGSSQIQVGMASSQVQQIMGAPAETEQNGAISEWKYITPQGKVKIKIQKNQVVGIERH